MGFAVEELQQELEKGISSAKEEHYELAMQHFRRVTEGLRETPRNMRPPQSFECLVHFGLGLVESLAEEEAQQSSPRGFNDLAVLVKNFHDIGVTLAMFPEDCNTEEHHMWGRMYSALGWHENALEIMDSGPSRYMKELRAMSATVTNGKYWEFATRYILDAVDGRSNDWDEVAKLLCYGE